MSGEGGLQRQFYEMLMESQWWSADQLRNYQRSQLSQLLRHAKKHVPFYERRLDAVVAQNGDIDWDRWNELPILKREDLAARGEAMVALELAGGHSRKTVATTSGTTGAPVTVTSTEVAHIALHANRFRTYHWHDIDTSKTCVSILGEEPDCSWPHGKALGTWGPPWDPDAIDGEFFRISRLATAEQLIEFFKRKRTRYVTTGPSSAFALALEARSLYGEAPCHFDAFLPHGASVEPEARAAIKQVFGARTVDLYSSKEAGHIAEACPEGPGLHINSESVLVEIVDQDGMPVPAGELGRVIVTPFFNAAQPLIRYDQGDLAMFGSKCSCGRHLQTLEKLIGRNIALFFHPDGRIRTSYLGHYRHLLHCQAWQIAQTGPTEFEVRYIPINSEIAGDEATFLSRLRESYFSDAEVRFARVDKLPAGPGGKTLEYVNEWRRPDAP